MRGDHVSFEEAGKGEPPERLESCITSFCCACSPGAAVDAGRMFSGRKRVSVSIPCMTKERAEVDMTYSG